MDGLIVSEEVNSETKLLPRTTIVLSLIKHLRLTSRAM